MHARAGRGSVLVLGRGIEDVVAVPHTICLRQYRREAHAAGTTLVVKLVTYVFSIKNSFDRVRARPLWELEIYGTPGCSAVLSCGQGDHSLISSCRGLASQRSLSYLCECCRRAHHAQNETNQYAELAKAIHRFLFPFDRGVPARRT
jgi:hypothetical protein